MAISTVRDKQALRLWAERERPTQAELRDRIIRDDPETLTLWREAMKLPPANQHVCKDDNIMPAKPEQGTSRSYTLSRLQRDRPERDRVS